MTDREVAACRTARTAIGKSAARKKGGELLALLERATESNKNKKALVAPALRLIAEGADPDFASEDTDLTPLMWASSQAELDSVAARLVAVGARLDLVDREGDSSLIFACITKRVATAMLLIESGAELNLVDAEGETALDVAIMRGLTSVAAALRARGGCTAAELASRRA